MFEVVGGTDLRRAATPSVIYKGNARTSRHNYRVQGELQASKLDSTGLLVDSSTSSA